MTVATIGWNTVEPIDLPRERACLLDNVIDAHRNRNGCSDDELAEIAYMTPGAFRQHYLRKPSRDQLGGVHA